LVQPKGSVTRRRTLRILIGSSVFARRRLLLAGGAALAMSKPALAQPTMGSANSYPQRPLRLLVGFPRGGPNDTLGRLIADWLARQLGQPINIENIPGNSGNIATEAVVRAKPDGYTLLLVGPANAINVSLSPNLPYDFTRDIVPVVGITREPMVMVVHPSVPARTVAEFVRYAKSHSQTPKMASTGTGSSPHVAGELFKMMAELTMPVVHYAGGGPALKAMIAGEAEMMFEPMSAAIEPVRSGALRAIAVSTATRSPALPGVATVGESIAGFEASAVTGLGVPRGTPVEIVAQLNRAVNAAYADPVMQARIADTGGLPLAGSPDEFAKVIAGEIEKWGRVIAFAKLRAG
jgi:tripartite-type tricarboxylate transporter receptor subunit TctC